MGEVAETISLRLQRERATYKSFGDSNFSASRTKTVSHSNPFVNKVSAHNKANTVTKDLIDQVFEFNFENLWPDLKYL